MQIVKFAKLSNPISRWYFVIIFTSDEKKILLLDCLFLPSINESVFIFKIKEIHQEGRQLRLGNFWLAEKWTKQINVSFVENSRLVKILNQNRRCTLLACHQKYNLGMHNTCMYPEYINIEKLLMHWYVQVQPLPGSYLLAWVKYINARNM